MVVDHHPPFRRAARALINATSGFESAGDAASALRQSGSRISFGRPWS
jgi:hypothetical protein